jgi:predicted ester cyclase
MGISMSDPNNKVVVRRYLEDVWNERNLEVTSQLVAAEYQAMPGAPRGPDGAKVLVQFFLAAFPDFVINIRDAVAEGDRVAVRYEFSGTHQGPWMGLDPTGRHVSVEGITLYRLANQQIVETFFAYDALGLLRQLGATSLPRTLA